MINFSVRAVNPSGEPLEDLEVIIDLGMGGHASENTDSDGWAEFEIAPIVVGSTRSVGIRVNGYEQGDYLVEDGETYSFTLDWDEL